MNLSDFLTENELVSLQNQKMLAELKRYMADTETPQLMINGYVLHVNDSQFRSNADAESIKEPDNCFLLYHFFVKYQYYNLAAAVKNNMVCSIKLK
jgi:hypothetical protein